MYTVQGSRGKSISRRHALALIGAIGFARGAGAAEAGLLQPVSLDHVNLRVTNVARSGAFYMGLFDTPVLRNPGLRARPDSPPSEGFFLKFGDGYLVISQAYAPEMPGLDHYSVGLRDYDPAKMAPKLRENGISIESRAVDIWAGDPEGNFIQLRPPGGWARQTATPFAAPPRVGPAVSPLSMSRIALRSADLGRDGTYYQRLFGTEIAAAASGGSRVFSLGDSTLELVAANATAARGMDHLRVAVKDFNADAIGRVLRDRGIAAEARAGTLRIADPDGIGIELAAAG